MNTYSISLEKYKSPQSIGLCPACGQKTFKFYINNETGKRIADHVGRCNRIDKCQYHLKPKQFFIDNGNNFDRTFITKPIERNKEMFTIPLTKMEATLINFHNNSFVMGLRELFGEKETKKLLTNYACIGTSKKMAGAVIFWQIDVCGNIRTGKIMSYDAKTLKRIKSSNPTWAHYGLVPEYEELRQCFFGEHLLRDKTKTVCITESEKTAIICSHFMPEYIWLAAGNIEGLIERKFQVLKSRKVVLFPDLGKGYYLWKKKANDLRHIADITVSDYLENIATDEQRADGLDLADYIINEQQKKKSGAAVQLSIDNYTTAPKINSLTRGEARDFLTFCDSLDKELICNQQIIIK